MNNIEKAKELVSKFKIGTSISPFVNDVMYDAILEMAEWKDEQFSVEKQELVDNAKDFLAEYFWEHPHEKSVIQSDEFTSIDDMLEKFENRIKGGKNEK